MFGTGHPQPPHRKEVAMQIVQQQQRDFDAHRLHVDPPGGAVAPPPLQALVLEVTTTLPEYLGFVRDHLAFTLRRMPRAQRLRQTWVPLAIALLAGAAAWGIEGGWLRMACAAVAACALACLPPTAAAWVALIGTPLYFLKRLRMPVSRLRIDAAGIERTTCLGTSMRAWSEVEGVRRYRQGYLLTMAQGAMAIPFRCLDRRQTEAFRRFATQRH
jgi:hypothetical protein